VLLMTEKDAVKCAAIPLGEAWVLPVEAEISAAADHTGLLETILEKLNGRTLA
jgi:tetraacyldisaccharide 4'-kinase